MADSKWLLGLAIAASMLIPAVGCSDSNGATSTDPGSSDGTLGAPAVRFVGRFDTSDPQGPQFEWSGSEMQARFSGTQVSVHLTGSPNWFEAVVDGQASAVQFAGGDQTLSIATGLASGEHEVSLYRATEAFFGSVQFLGFDFGTGSLLAPPDAPDRRIEVIGDSISTGHGDEGKSGVCSSFADTENQYFTYEAISARDLGADLVTIAWTGIGMYRNAGQDMGNPRMPHLYLLTRPDLPHSGWDFASWIPHAVVINLGTNDFIGGDPGRPYVDAYVKFVTDMRGRYPDALIYLATSPILREPAHSGQAAHLQDVISQRAAQGDNNLKILDFATLDPADGLGCDRHPNLVSHQKMSVEMTAAIKVDLGW